MVDAITGTAEVTDLIDRIKDLEAKYRKPLNSPRAFATAILNGSASLNSVPEHMRPIVDDHIATHEMLVNAHADRIWKLQNGKERLAAFNEIKARHPGMAEAVSKRVKQLREKR